MANKILCIGFPTESLYQMCLILISTLVHIFNHQKLIMGDIQEPSASLDNQKSSSMTIQTTKVIDDQT